MLSPTTKKTRHQERGSALNPLSPYPKAGSALENPALLQLRPICIASLFHSSQTSKLSWALLHLHPSFPGSQLTAESISSLSERSPQGKGLPLSSLEWEHSPHG